MIGLYALIHFLISIQIQDITDFLTKPGGEAGIIYMSFGSFAEISDFPPETRDVFMNTLRKLKNYKILWKINVERPSGLPDYVYTAKWMPQQAILGKYQYNFVKK